MKNDSVTIGFDEEKLAALRLYLAQKQQTVEDELTASLDALYTKTVPSNVREFIDLRAGVAASEPKKRKPRPIPPEPKDIPPTEAADGEDG